MRKHYLLMLLSAVAIGIVAALVLVIPQAPVPEAQGSAPSVSTGSAGVEPQPPESTARPREVQAGTNSGRDSRGSGIEGVTSSGTVTQ